MHASSNRRLGALIGLLIIACIFFFVSRSEAAQPLPPAPPQGYCYVTLNAAGYQDVNPCANTPPPPPVNDPLAISPILFKYTAHQCSSAVAANGQDFAAIYGTSPNLPMLQWPYRPNSVQYSAAAGKRYSAVIQLPANPGTIYHTIKGDPYAGACGGSSAGVRVNVSVIAMGTTPAPTGTCSKLNTAFDGSPWLYLDPSGATNPYRCNLKPLGVYRFIIQTVDGRSATMLTTWN